MKTVADLLPLFVNEPLAFEPAAKWQYSNSGYVVLGAIVEKVSGQNYFDYVKEYIFKPANMSNTDCYEKDASVPNLAIGYTRMSSTGQSEPTTPRRGPAVMGAPKPRPHLLPLRPAPPWLRRLLLPCLPLHLIRQAAPPWPPCLRPLPASPCRPCLRPPLRAVMHHLIHPIPRSAACRAEKPSRPRLSPNQFFFSDRCPSC